MRNGAIGARLPTTQRFRMLCEALSSIPSRRHVPGIAGTTGAKDSGINESHRFSSVGTGRAELWG
jgi:hypothetical protein